MLKATKDDIANNQALFNKEMADVLTANDFSNFYKRLLNASVVNLNSFNVRKTNEGIGIRFSREQAEKVISWSRDADSGSLTTITESILINNVLLDLVSLGSRVVSLSEEDLGYCLCHANQAIRRRACWRFNLLSTHIDMVLGSYKENISEENDLIDIVIERYAKKLSRSQIENIQLNGTIHACHALWLAEVGDSPIKRSPGMDRNDFMSVCDKEVFASWRSAYRARIESDKLKRLGFVSKLGEIGKDNVIPRRQEAL